MLVEGTAFEFKLAKNSKQRLVFRSFKRKIELGTSIWVCMQVDGAKFLIFEKSPSSLQNPLPGG